LGFLNYHPYTGYELKKIFDTSVRHFWPADQSQIYRTLARLMEQGYADMEKVQQEDHPDRKVYHITDAGRTELLRWLAGPAPLTETRSTALVQVFFFGQLSDQEILARFEDYVATVRAILSHYESIPRMLDPYYAEIRSPRERFFWMLTLENGLGSVRASLEWAQSVIDRIRRGEVPQH